MDLRIAPISIALANTYFKTKTAFQGDFDLAICVKEGEKIRGVIALNAMGRECSLAHLYTDGTALVGSILYGAAWRAAKALGYKQITI